MRIAVLQYAPQLERPVENIAKVDALLALHLRNESVDLIVLPELALIGYNHTRESITPLLEPTAAGRSTQWAIQTARAYTCLVTVGYAEGDGREDVPAYNAQVTVDGEGTIVAHYRKTHLYYTDEAWAQESPTGWLNQTLTTDISASFGICMDLNPYQFTASWTAYEFCTAALAAKSNTIILSMAWLTELSADELADEPAKPDLKTLAYWLERLSPIRDANREVLIICANRCGQEGGAASTMEPESSRNHPQPGPSTTFLEPQPGVRYAGSSWVGRLGKGKVEILGILGRGEESVLFVTDE